MRILGISGSPKEKGFTNLLLDEFLDGARAAGAHTGKIILNSLKIEPCQECWKCDDEGICAYADDMKIVHEKIKDADAVIIASPIYFGSITAQLKTMIDRFNSTWVLSRRGRAGKPPDLMKKGVFICVAGDNKKEYFKNAKSVIKALFGTIGIKYSKELFVGGLDKLKDDSTKKKELFLKSYELGSSLAKTIFQSG